MTFRFSLQRILDLREAEASEAQKQVDATKKTIMQLKKILEIERDNYFIDREALNEAVKKVEFTEITVYEKSLSLHQNKMMELLKAIKEIQNDLKIQESVLVQAKINKKVIEKLYTIKGKEYEKKEQLREQYVLDELATQGFIKNRFEEENEE